MKYICSLIIAALLIISCESQRVVTAAPAQETPSTSSQPTMSKGPKNIILMIGDGMGLTQISAGIYSNDNKSNFERMSVIGLHKPYSADKLITDSAAGATAFACGQKTYNGAIAVGSDSLPIPTILEEAKHRGLACGLISTCTITHATPASFIAHNVYRKNYEDIAEDFLDTDLDYFVGGGRKYFDARDKDDRNLITELRDKGYEITSYFETELNEVTVPKDKNFGYFTASEEPLRRSEGRDYLPLAVTKGLEHLSQDPKGFFLMIEGSQIDWGGHANDFPWVLDEWNEFNSVLGQVLDWARADGETLVVVTADHETGGLAIQPDSKMNEIEAAFTSDYHTGTLIPVFAYGPSSKQFAGIYENTAIYDKMRSAYQWDINPLGK